MGVGVRSDAPQPLRTMINGKHPGHRGQQSLSRTDIRRGPFAFDVLFAHLERHAQRRIPQTVYRYADDTSGHVSFVGIQRGHIAGMGSPEAHRDTETLGRTHRNVSFPFGRSLQHGQRQNVSHGRHQHTPFMTRGRKGRVVGNLTVGTGVLQHSTKLFARKLILPVRVYR